MSDKGLELALEAKSIFTRADAEGREPTAEERAYVEQLLDQAAHEKSRQRIDQIGRQIGPPGGSNGLNRLDSLDAPTYIPSGGPGDRLIQSKAYTDLFGPGATRGENWSTGMIEVTDGPPMQFKGTLGESGAISGGQPFVSVPQLLPGAVVQLFQPLSFESLLSSRPVDGPTLRYIVEGTATNAAAGVAEGGTKPESTLGLTYTDEPIKKVATWITLTDEMMEDAPAIQQYVNGRLSLFVQLEIEKELFRGASGGSTVQGLLTSRSVPIYTGGTTDDKAAQLFKAANSMRGSAFVEPEFFVLHPTDWQLIRLRQDTSNNYMGGGPFLGPYGGPQGPVPAAGQITGNQDSLWGKPVYVTSAIGGAGTALVGTRDNAMVLSRGGLRIEASTSHASYFQTNLIAVRCERRVGLAVLRPTGYVEARLAVGPGG